MRLARTLSLALVAALLATAPAYAAGRLVVRGRGYGHGVGMSQYGAFGYAKHGVGYREILAHYYTGTSLGQTDPGRQVRVLLDSSSQSLSFSGATRIGDRDLSPETTYSVRTSGIDRLVLRSPGGHTLDRFGSEVSATGDGPLTLRGVAANGVRNGQYRGSLVFRRGAIGGVLAIDSLSLELYVRGVISAESPSGWPADALRAQAVAARTYAITTNAGGSAGFDQYADTRSQMYRGVAAEFPSTDDAQRSTEGQVVTYNGQPVVTYFFSTSGGQTENVENSFLGSTAKQWLKSVDDPYDDASPKHTWTIRMSLKVAAARLGGLVKGSFRGIKVVERGASPRVVHALVLGTRGSTPVTGPQLRARLRLYDTWASFVRITSTPKKKSKSKPKTPAPSTPSDPSGGTPPEGSAAAAASAGMMEGDVSAATAGNWVRLQRLVGDHWVTMAWTTVGRHGRYRITVPSAGHYRILWHGLDGPTVAFHRVQSLGRSRAK
jgi:stage II sporulation protein D